jgi:hypothetical protein
MVTLKDIIKKIDELNFQHGSLLHYLRRLKTSLHSDVGTMLDIIIQVYNFYQPGSISPTLYFSYA